MFQSVITSGKCITGVSRENPRSIWALLLDLEKYGLYHACLITVLMFKNRTSTGNVFYGNIPLMVYVDYF